MKFTTKSALRVSQSDAFLIFHNCSVNVHSSRHCGGGVKGYVNSLEFIVTMKTVGFYRPFAFLRTVTDFFKITFAKIRKIGIR